MNDAQEHCKCKHPFSSHTRDVRAADGMRVDDALLGKTKRHDIFSDKSVGESGCNECSCRQWKPAKY
jgi:hypothetical protein